MEEFNWRPEKAPMSGSTVFASETFFLVQKSASQFCRVQDFEILNTEIRSQLFMHSYGYLQTAVNFGNLATYLDRFAHTKAKYMSLLGSDVMV